MRKFIFSSLMLLIKYAKAERYSLRDTILCKDPLTITLQTSATDPIASVLVNMFQERASSSVTLAEMRDTPLFTKIRKCRTSNRWC